MSGLRSVAYGAMLGIILACMLPTCAAAQTQVGVIFESSPALKTGAVHDAVVEGLGRVEGYEVAVLHHDSPLLAAWEIDPSALDMGADDGSASLSELAATLELDEIFSIDVSPQSEDEVGYTVSVAAAKAGDSEVARFELPLADTGTGAVSELSRRMAEAVRSSWSEKTPDTEMQPPQPPQQDTADQPEHADTEAKEPTEIETTPAPGTEKSPAAEGPEPGTDQQPVKPAPETPEPREPAPETDSASQEQPPAQSHIQQARSALATGDRDLALRHLQAAIKAGEPQGAIYLLRADMARLQSDHVAERKWLQKAAATQSHGTQASLRLAHLFADQRLWQKALETYRRILEDDPENLQASTGIARVLCSLDRPREAAKTLSEAVSRHPDNHALRVRLGDAYREAGMLAEAEEAYDLAARSGDKELRAKVFDRLGDLYVEADRYEEGFYCYAEAARLQSDEDAPLSPKRYGQIMSTADEAVLAAMKKIADTHERYATYEDIPREAAYETAEKTVAQLEEVSKFAKSVTPPKAARRAHLQRKLFYSVALEAAVSLMTYLDTNLDIARRQYERSVDRVNEEYSALKSAGG